MATASPPTTRRRSSQLSLHHGNILARVAATYPGLFENGAVMELVQNAIDSGAENIWVRINLLKRSIIVQDDGSGASIENFDEALSSVGQTLKRKGKLGRFGIGLVSPMGKCARFIFTSTPKDNSRGYHEWTFECAAIQEMSDEIKIPMRSRSDLQFSRSADKGVPWRTEMKIEDFRRDLRVQRLTRDSLTRSIQERFSKAMDHKNTVIHMTITWAKDKGESWKITAQSFKGASISKLRTTNTDFDIYLAKPGTKGQRKGTILVGESFDDFRIDFATFLKHSAGDILPDEVAQALGSGIFEGEIVNAKIKLNSDRTSFEVNEALVAFCADLEKWFRDIGISHVEEVKTASREERYQRLGVRSMKVLEELIHSSAALQKFVNDLKIGTQGKAHSDTGNKVGPQETPSISTHSAQTERGKADVKKLASSGETPNESHMPFSVMGPKGRRRTVVKGDSLGLQFSYEGLEGSIRLWNLDTKSGVITFNTRHPLWLQAEEGGDRSLMELQEQIAVHALHLEMSPGDWREAMEMHIEDTLPSLIFLLLKADKIAGRKTIVHQLPTKGE